MKNAMMYSVSKWLKQYMIHKLFCISTVLSGISLMEKNTRMYMQCACLNQRTFGMLSSLFSYQSCQSYKLVNLLVNMAPKKNGKKSPLLILYSRPNVTFSWPYPWRQCHFVVHPNPICLAVMKKNSFAVFWFFPHREREEPRALQHSLPPLPPPHYSRPLLPPASLFLSSSLSPSIF
jgi:hypothetical protein